MFGIFKSKSADQAEMSVDDIAKELFGQIEAARDEAKSAEIIDEKTFNDRLNHMYTAGYLIGYVDYYMGEMFAEDSDKKEHARQVYERMFPGVGMDFVKSRLKARQRAVDLPQNSSMYKQLAPQCAAFDKGFDDARYEVHALQENSSNQPQQLKEFLLLGEV